MKNKILFRVDGSYHLGMGDIISMINLAEKLDDFEILEILFVSKYMEGIKKINEFGYKVEKIPEDINLKEEIGIIKKINEKFKSNVIIVELIRNDYQEYCRELSKINKTLIIDFFGNIEVYSDILVNWDILSKNRKYIKKNKNTIYCLGPKYSLLKEQVYKYHNLNKLIKDKVETVLITMGGTDPRNLTPKIINALKNFKNIKFNVVMGSAFRNKDEIKRILKDNNLKYDLIENPNELLELIYNVDLAICAGGLTSFELCAIGTPFIGISNIEWEADRLKRMEEKGICKYAGDWKNFDEKELYNIFKDFVYNKEEREKMSINGKKLLDGRGAERISNIIKEVIKNGNKTNS